MQGLVANPANRAVIATDPESLRQANTRDQLALILGLQNALIFGTEVAAIDEWFGAGVRVFVLTHTSRNDFADSSWSLFDAKTGQREPAAEHGGLSDLGVAVQPAPILNHLAVCAGIRLCRHHHRDYLQEVTLKYFQEVPLIWLTVILQFARLY